MKNKQKVQSTLHLDSEIKLVGSIIAKSKGMTFSSYVENLIFEDIKKYNNESEEQ